MWLIEVAIEPETKADQQRLDSALPELAANDPTLGFQPDRESGHTILRGMTEGQLDRAIGVLRNTYGVIANVGSLQVAYRETIGRRAEIIYTHKTATEDSAEFAGVRIIFEPAERGAGYAFENRAGDDVPTPFVVGVQMGLRAAMEEGLLAGFPVVDLHATLAGGTYNDVDSTPSAFEIAARAAFGELCHRGSPRLLEPIMRMAVTTPEVFVGDVIGDLNARRGMITGSVYRRDSVVITGDVPLSNLFGYAHTLGAMSQGEAEFEMEFDRYEVMPPLDQTDPDPDLFPPAAAMRA
jgi:elongation factor G